MRSRCTTPLIQQLVDALTADAELGSDHLQRCALVAHPPHLRYPLLSLTLLRFAVLVHTSRLDDPSSLVKYPSAKQTLESACREQQANPRMNRPVSAMRSRLREAWPVLT